MAKSIASHAARRSVWRGRALGLATTLALVTPAVAIATASGAATVPNAPVIGGASNWGIPAVPAGHPEFCNIVRPTGWAPGEQAGRAADPHSLNNAEQSWLATPAYWNQGYFGQGVDIALIDSGVASLPGLNNGNVVQGPDLSIESQAAFGSGGNANPDLAHADGFNHGTHLAGLMVGSDVTDVNRSVAAGTAVSATAFPWKTATGQAPAYIGVAPMSRVVSVKVADAVGTVDVTQVIAAIDWVVARNDAGMNIRVLNLSFGIDALDSAQNDALSYAVDQAWNNGIVVVAAAGNGGKATDNKSPGVTSPAYNRNVIAVGAVDADPSVASSAKFSSGASGANPRTPDLAVPGVSLPSFHVNNSFADSEIRDDCRATVSGATTVGATAWNQPVFGPDGRFVKASGTSQAAALVSGAVALMLSRNKDLTPDQVKRVLKVSAIPVPVGQRQKLAGAGELNLDEALQYIAKDAGPRNSQMFSPSGGGTLDDARGGDFLIDGSIPGAETTAKSCNLSHAVSTQCLQVQLNGDRDIFGQPINVRKLEKAEKAGAAWVRNAFDASQEVWVGDGGVMTLGSGFTLDPKLLVPAWRTADWTTNLNGRSWSGRRWSDNNWSGRRWSGNDWSSNDWSGRRWSDASWSGRRWSDHTWRDADWS